MDYKSSVLYYNSIDTIREGRQETSNNNIDTNISTIARTSSNQ